MNFEENTNKNSKQPENKLDSQIGQLQNLIKLSIAMINLFYEAKEEPLGGYGGRKLR